MDFALVKNNISEGFHNGNSEFVVLFSPALVCQRSAQGLWMSSLLQTFEFSPHWSSYQRDDTI